MPGCLWVHVRVQEIGDNVNAMRNGDVTCLIWEETSMYEIEVNLLLDDKLLTESEGRGTSVHVR